MKPSYITHASNEDMQRAADEARMVDPELVKCLEESVDCDAGCYPEQIIPILNELANTGIIDTMGLSQYWCRDGWVASICALKHDRVRNVSIGLVPNTAEINTLKESHTLKGLKVWMSISDILRTVNYILEVNASIIHIELYHLGLIYEFPQFLSALCSHRPLLEDLNIMYNLMGSTEQTCLSSFLTCAGSNLTILDLNMCNLSDKFLEELEPALKKNNSLTRLSLCDNPLLSKEGAPPLVAILRSHPTIISLGIMAIMLNGYPETNSLVNLLMYNDIGLHSLGIDCSSLINIPLENFTTIIIASKHLVNLTFYHCDCGGIGPQIASAIIANPSIVEFCVCGSREYMPEAILAAKSNRNMHSASDLAFLEGTLEEENPISLLTCFPHLLQEIIESANPETGMRTERFPWEFNEDIDSCTLSRTPSPEIPSS
jgi:hypothetical protein